METLLHWWPIILVFVTYFIGVVIWFTRLEARVNDNTKNLARVEQRFEEQRKEDLQDRERYHDKLDKRLEVIQNDIKILLQKRD